MLLLGARKYNDDDPIYSLDFLIDNIFVEFGGRVIQETNDILMSTNN